MYRFLSYKHSNILWIIMRYLKKDLRISSAIRRRKRSRGTNERAHLVCFEMFYYSFLQLFYNSLCSAASTIHVYYREDWKMRTFPKESLTRLTITDDYYFIQIFPNARCLIDTLPLENSTYLILFLFICCNYWQQTYLFAQ